jgi:hypothetical protein
MGVLGGGKRHGRSGDSQSSAHTRMYPHPSHIPRPSSPLLSPSPATEQPKTKSPTAHTVAPLGDAVRLVDDEAREEAAVLEAAQALEHGLGARELLRGDVQEL